MVKKNFILFQAILMAFRSPNTLDKTVESCSISISDKNSKTKIEMRCRFDVVKIYTLPFIECESIKVSHFCGQLNCLRGPEFETQ